MSALDHWQGQTPAERERDRSMYREWVRRKAAAPPELKDGVLYEVLREFYPEDNA